MRLLTGLGADGLKFIATPFGKVLQVQNDRMQAGLGI